MNGVDSISRRAMVRSYPALLKAYKELKDGSGIKELKRQIWQRDDLMKQVNHEAIRVMDENSRLKRNLIETQTKLDEMVKKYDALVEHANTLNRKLLVAV